MTHFRSLFLLLISMALITLIACPNEPSRVPSNNNDVPAVASISTHSPSGSYSIFHDTMVDMTWLEVEKAAKDGALVLLPIAVIEEHGPHMGCGIDTYLGYLTCALIRRELESRGLTTIIAPPFYWGINRTSHVFPGTFTVRDETMKALLHDIHVSLKSWGFHKIFNVIAHGDGYHNLAAFESIRDARETLGIDAYAVVSDFDARRFGLTGKEPFVLIHTSPPFDKQSSKYLDFHAGAFETGLVAAFFPDLVDTELARTLKPTKLTGKNVGKWLKDARNLTPSGYVGDPAAFDPVEAKEFWEEYCRMIADSIEDTIQKK